MKKKILLACNMPEEAYAKYKDEFDITVPEEWLSYDEIYDVIDQYEGYFTLSERPVDKKLLDKAVKLEVVGNLGVGTNHIDSDYAAEKGVAVCNSPLSVSDGTAEHIAIMIFDILRGITRQDRWVRNGKWFAPQFPTHNMAVNGATLGIFGFGRIGRMVAKKCQGLGMKVVYNNRTRLSEELEKELDVTYMTKEELLKNADVISLNMPLTADSEHFIDMDALKLMKPTACLVNGARGACVDEKALYEALKNGIIRGAACDVFENEPHPYEKLFELDNLIMTPHCASGTLATRLAMVQESMDGMVAVLRGEPLPVNCINKKLLENK
ncbi:MAG: NAD(P)-dependent oxidoreductase [Eubacteriales bacterium]|nr:NAD(P)-dependent oxidoreductase [Eubacteriales bacterium]